MITTLTDTPRTFSITKWDDSILLDQALKQEIKDACAQINFVGSVLGGILDVQLHA